MSTVKRILEMARADCELNWWQGDEDHTLPPEGKVCAGTALQIAGEVLNVSEEIIQNTYDSFRLSNTHAHRPRMVTAGWRSVQST